MWGGRGRCGDRFALRLLAIQARYYLREIVRRRDRTAIDEHARSLGGLAAGSLHGLTRRR